MNRNRNIDDNNDAAHYFDDNNILSNSEVYRCLRCGGNDTKYLELQTRLPDIPSSIFITCKTCGNSWRI